LNATETTASGSSSSKPPRGEQNGGRGQRPQRPGPGDRFNRHGHEEKSPACASPGVPRVGSGGRGETPPFFGTQLTPRKCGESPEARGAAATGNRIHAKALNFAMERPGKTLSGAELAEGCIGPSADLHPGWRCSEERSEVTTYVPPGAKAEGPLWWRPSGPYQSSAAL